MFQRTRREEDKTLSTMNKNKELRTEEEKKRQNKQILDIVIAGISLLALIILKGMKVVGFTWIPFLTFALSLIHLKLIGKRR